MKLNTSCFELKSKKQCHKNKYCLNKNTQHKIVLRDENMENKNTKYKKDYLTNVTVRLEFSKILKLSGNNKEAAEEFRRYIFDKSPNVNFKVNNHGG